MSLRTFLGAAALATLLVAGDARAGEATVALGEVAAPPTDSGVDRASLKDAAERELLDVDAAKIKKHRKVVMSVAIMGSEQAPFGCTISAVLLDAKTGTMLAVLQGRARAEGNATTDRVRQHVLRVALRNAVRQIPAALAAR